MFLSAGWLPTTRLSRNGVANSRDATLDNRYSAPLSTQVDGKVINPATHVAECDLFLQH